MSFTVYKSSAGSGKTYTLVKEYLSLVLKNPYKFRQVLAITFTNKAANEMKQRVLLTLSQLTDYNKTKNEKNFKLKFLLEEIGKETGLTEDEIIDNAKLTHSLILHNYSNFAISTIDSFVQRIVRTFAHDLNLPMNFNIELDGENLISKAVDLLIDQLGNNELLTDFVFDFAKTKMDDDKSWHIDDDLKKFAEILLKEESQLKIEKINQLKLEDFNKILNKIRQLQKAFENKISLIGKEATEKINSFSLSKDVFYQGKNGIAGYFEKTANRKIVKPNNYVNATVNGNKWTSAKADTSDKIAIDNIKDFLISKYNELSELFENEYETYVVRNAILKNLYSLALLNEIEKFIYEIRENEYTVHISEFQKRISEIVVKEPAPFIYERLGEKFKHFLIDEFQDTSILQWQNLLPLIDNSLAENHFNMIVGDGKQAIYRFRGGEVEQFAMLPEIYKKSDNSIVNERENTLKRNYIEKFLNANYRSKAEIVEFNNSFFSYVSEVLSEDLKKIYDNHKQEFSSENKGGYVGIEFIETENTVEYETQTKLRILNTISDLINDGYKWKDITILCRNNLQANKIALFLSEQNIEVISSESLLLKSSNHVRLMISLLKTMLNPEDRISKSHILLYVAGMVERNNQIKNPLNLLNGFNFEQSEFENYIKNCGFDFELKKLSQLTLYQLCENLLEIFKLNELNSPYLHFFLDNVLNFTIKQNSGIAGFLEWWDKKKENLSLKTSSGINAVNIMTIHKSKGLEFEIVIFPFADEKQRKTNDTLWIDSEDADLPELTTALINLNADLKETHFAKDYHIEIEKSRLDLINLLYVALTRPSERLYLFTQNSNIKSDSENITISSLLKNYLISLSLWDENIKIYHFGKCKKLEKKEELIENNTLVFEPSKTVDWQQKLQISSLAPDNWQTDDPDKHRRIGNQIHLVLSAIENKDDAEKIIDKIADNKFIITDKSELKKLILSLINNKEADFLFDKKYKTINEADILLKNGKSIRPDKVLVGDNEVIIIDFKSGKPNDSHRTQLDNYELVVSEMGYKNIYKCLIYIGNPIEFVKWK